MVSGPSSDIQHQQSSAKAARSINCMSCTSSVWHLGHERNGGASWLVRTRLCTSISDSVDANARGRTSAVASANSRMEHNDMPLRCIGAAPRRRSARCARFQPYSGELPWPSILDAHGAPWSTSTSNSQQNEFRHLLRRCRFGLRLRRCSRSHCMHPTRRSTGEFSTIWSVGLPGLRCRFLCFCC